MFRAAVFKHLPITNSWDVSDGDFGTVTA